MMKMSVGKVVPILLFAFVLVCGLPWISFPVLLFVAFLASGGRNFPKVFFKTIVRDLRGFYRFGKMLLFASKCAKNNITVDMLFQETVARHPNKTAIIFEDKKWTFQEVEDYSNKIANYYQSLGYQKGDVVALFMESCPEYVCLWLGLAKLGVATALINFNLRLDSLMHCISVAKARALIFGTELNDAAKDVLDKLPEDMQVFAKGNSYELNARVEHLDRFLKECSPRPPTTTHTKLFTDNLVYIYTSGTTGLPKAAVMRNSRFLSMGYGIHVAMDSASVDDIVYCPLPLYHSAGGVIGLGACFFFGATLVVRRKFSASRFWPECVQHRVTVVQYIGELCRFLLAQPPLPTDTQHRVRLALGNGLKPRVWEEFQRRFKVPRVGEFYGSTEGNVGLLNFEGKPGACGFLSEIVPSLYPVRIVKVDPDTGEIMRGADGRLMKCKAGEVGTPVGILDKSGSPVTAFHGYLSKKETDRKLAHDAFKKGDTVFLSGDLLVKDEYGYVYFKDRTGDTFRWRGENVSTAEVEDVISKVVALKNVVVYGVEVPCQDGKAGMAALDDPEQSVDLSVLAKELKRVLPSYARPVFLRIVRDVEMTGTFKLQKVKLRKEGFDLNQVQDALYYLDPKWGEYVAIDRQNFDELMAGRIRL